MTTTTSRLTKAQLAASIDALRTELNTLRLVNQQLSDEIATLRAKPSTTVAAPSTTTAAPASHIVALDGTKSALAIVLGMRDRLAKKYGACVVRVENGQKVLISKEGALRIVARRFDDRIEFVAA